MTDRETGESNPSRKAACEVDGVPRARNRLDGVLRLHGCRGHLSGFLVEAHGFRAVEGDAGGFVMVPSVREAHDITYEEGADGATLRLDFGEMSLLLTDDFGLRRDA
jgi:hypothetical protein